MRDPESCPHRDPSDTAPGAAWCRLAGELSGLGPRGVGVGADACRACCRRAVPGLGRINPVIASLVSGAVSRARDEGGPPGWSSERTALFLRWASAELAVAHHVGDGRASANGRAETEHDTPSVGVAVLGRNAAEDLAAVVAIARAQTLPPREVVLVPSGGGSGLAAIPGARPCPLHAGDEVDPLSPFRAAVDALETEIICFLGDGDAPPADYLERGLPLFRNPAVALVYSDVEYNGGTTGRTFTPEFDPEAIERDPHIIHRGALARRSALLATDALRAARVPAAFADRAIWSRVLGDRWRAERQSSVFRKRFDPDELARGPVASEPSYFDRAALAAADVTIFTPLAGRTGLWGDYTDWLRTQTWPRSQCRVFLVDTSGDAAFGRAVRQFLASSDYPDTRYAARAVAEPGLADRPRGDHLDAVRLACARIYHEMATEITTRFVLIVEDDVIPPPEVIERLLHSLDAATDAAAAPYRARLHSNYVVWDDGGRNLAGGQGVQAVGGSGFGCLLVRRGALGRMQPPGAGEPPDIDRAFGRRLRRDRRTFKVDWSQECRHLAGPEGVVLAKNFGG